MKKFIISIIFSFITICCFAQNDTIPIKDSIKFDFDEVFTKTGKLIKKYYIEYKGVYYESNKTSYDRYKTIKKFNGVPCVVAIQNKRKSIKKIIVL